MEYIQIGKTNLKISRLGLGTMTFGDAKETNKPWLLDQEQSDQVVKKALELGINFFDTGIFYNKGKSEIYLGNSLKKYAKRDQVIIGTKMFCNEGLLSREAILREVGNSLKRLQTDYIDIFTVSRWDYNTPIEETLGALNELIKEGKIRYIGCSSIFAYQLAKAQECARKNNWQGFVVIQNLYNLIYREEEREMIQLLKEEGILMTPYAPLAAGRISRVWESDSLRYKNDLSRQNYFGESKDVDIPIILRIKELADKRGITMTEISLAWLLSKENVASPIVGVTKIEHLNNICKAVNIKLTNEEIKYLEELYVPHKIVAAMNYQQFLEFLPKIKKIFG